ncbi:hypothetical protein Droror1_Dr00009835 [Drosera rotundifolia]
MWISRIVPFKLYWLSEIQWEAFVLLCAGCTTTQLNSNSDQVLQTHVQGWVMAIVMALLSGFAGVYTEAIIKKRPQRNINVQNFGLYVFGMVFNLVAILLQDFDVVINKGFFHGYSFITVLMIVNHALSECNSGKGGRVLGLKTQLEICESCNHCVDRRKGRGQLNRSHNGVIFRGQTCKKEKNKVCVGNWVCGKGKGSS